LSTATSLEIVYNQRSANPASFVEISRVDVETIGLTKITEIFLKQQQNISPARLRLAQSGWAKNTTGCAILCWYAGTANAGTIYRP